MRRQKAKIAIVFILIMIVGIGYAFLNAKLTINGTSNFSANSWLIYFDDIRPNASNNVEATEPAVITDSAKTNISFDVNLDKPGDFYEFDVYIKNDGTIDAIIDEVIMPELTETEKKYMTFSYTYIDGTKIRKCDKLNAESFRDTRLRVEYLEDGDLDLVPDEGTRHFDVTIKYVQDGECERPADEYTLTIDPDGGIYDESTELRTVRLSSGEVYTLATPTKEGFDFEGWEEVTETSSLNNNVVTVGEGNIRVKAIWIDSSTPTINLTINPDGGIYNDTTELTTVSLRSGRTYKVAKPTKEGYTFVRWEEVSETNTYSDFQVVAGEVNIELKAIWGDKIAKIVRGEDQFYSSIQAAIDDASNGETIYLLKDTTEEFVNNKNVTIDLSGYKVTGSGTNSSVLTIINGAIENTGGVAFTNTGTLTIGINDDNVCDVGNISVTCGYENGFVSLVGTTKGLVQDGTFNFYDGFIEGELAIVGKVDQTSVYDDTDENDIKYYQVIIDKDRVKQDQKAYQSYIDETTTSAVSKTIEGGVVYYYDLSDNFDVSAETGYKIYAVRNFEGAYELDVPANTEIEFDIIGKTVEIGNYINVDGTLKLTNSKSTGVLNVSHPFKTQGTVEFKDIEVNMTSSTESMIENTGVSTLNLTNATLTSLDNCVLNNKSSTITINADDNSSIKANNSAIIIDDGTVTINGGTYSGGNESYGSTIKINKGNLVFNSGTIDSEKQGYDYKAIRIPDGNKDALIEINGGTINSTNKAIECSSKSKHVIHMKDGEVNARITNCKLIMDDGLITSNKYSNYTIENCYSIINGGKVYYTPTETYSDYGAISGEYTEFNDGEIVSANTGIKGKFTINGGTIKTKNYGVTGAYRDTSYITGGTIESENYGINATGNYTIFVTGGTIKGDIYGIKQDSVDTTVILGENEENGIPSRTSPVIIGGTYGIYKTKGNLKMYDGLLKGKTGVVEGVINEYPEGYDLNTSEIETIPDSEEVYNKGYLVSLDPFLQVGEYTYNSFNKLFKEESANTIVIDVIDEGYIYNDQTIPEGKNVTLNLNGHTIEVTHEIINNAVLTINDTKVTDPETGEEVYKGKIESVVGSVLKLNNDTTINGGTYLGAAYTSDIASISLYNGNLLLNNVDIRLTNSWNANSAIVVKGNTSAIEITDSNIISESSAINCNNNNSITFNSGYIEGKGRVLSTCNSTINGGHIHSTGGTTIYQGSATIKGGYISSDERGTIGSANLIIDGGTIESKKLDGYEPVVIEGGNSTLFKSGLIKGAIGVNVSNFTMTGGTIEATNYGLKNINNATITGGIIKGGNSGIYNESNGYSITLGEDTEDTPNITTPVIIGGINGIYTRNGYLNFYDGIVKGKTTAIDGQVNLFPDGYLLNDSGTEVDGEDTYHLAYVEAFAPFLRVGEHEYSSFNKLFSNETANDITIEVFKDGLISANQTIPEGKTVTLKLNGNTITTSAKIINNADLTIEDNLVTNGNESSYQGGFVVNTETLIETYNKLTLKGGNITATARAGQYLIVGRSSSIDAQAGTITINEDVDKDVKDTSAFYLYRNTTLDLKDEMKVYNYSRTHTNNGQRHRVVTCEGYQVDTIAINITGGYYTGGDGVFNGGTVNMSGGVIESRFTALNDGKLYMTGGTIRGLSNSFSYLIYDNYIELRNGLIENNSTRTDSYAIYCPSVNIIGGTIRSANGNGVSGVNPTYITGGIIEAGNTGVNTFSKNVYITGGEITGGVYGVYQRGGDITFGENEENGIPSKSNPSITGGTYGLYRTSGTVKIYDGIFKGKTGAIEGVVEELAPDSFIKTDSEIINENEEDVTYEVKYLEQEYLFITNTTQHVDYSKFSLAMSEAHDNDKFEVFKSASSYDAINIDKNITIDFKGFNIIAENGLTIAAGKTVVLKNTGSSTNGKLNTTHTVNLITNNGTLIISNIDLENRINSYYLIVNKGIFTLNDSSTYSNYLVEEYDNSESYFNRCNVTTTDLPISAKGTTEITGGTWTTPGQAYLLSTSGISNVTIDGTTSTGGLNITNASTVEVKNSSMKYVVNNKGTLKYDNVTHVHDVERAYGGSTFKNEEEGKFEIVGGSINISSVNDCRRCGNPNILNNGEMKIDSVNITMTNTEMGGFDGIRQESNIPMIIKDSTITKTNNNVNNIIAVSAGLGVLNISGSTINASNITNRNDTISKGIATKGGTINLTNTTVNSTDAKTSYGAFLDDGTINVSSDDTKIQASGDNAYGVYLNTNTSTINLGEEETDSTKVGTPNATVNQAKPYIEGIGTTTGYGTYNRNGFLNFYDGKAVGSTNARYGTTSNWEYHWELRQHLDENNYEYSILEYNGD